MIQILKQISHALSQRYQDDFGLALKPGSGSDAWQNEIASWRVGGLDVGGPVTDAQQVEHEATLFDSEVGVIVCFALFTTEHELRRTINHALAKRSVLKCPVTKSELSDDCGSWRVVITWLVPATMGEAFIEAISDVRDTTGFSEELSFERLLFQEGSEKMDADSYEYPRLQFAVRRALSFRGPSDAESWLSADRDVRALLETLPLKFTAPKEKELARGIARIEAGNTSNPEGEPFDLPEWTSSRQVDNFVIENFRNIKKVRLSFIDRPVRTLVIFGPNGTGKSAVAEAFALARFGTSPRLKQYLDKGEEKDVVGSDRRRSFVQSYLTPMTDPTRTPEYTVGNTKREFSLAPEDLVNDQYLKMERSVLTQEQSIRFLRMGAAECALRVLQGYSDLADTVKEYVEREAARASDIRQEFLRSVEVSAQTTKIETVQQKIAEAKLESLQLEFPSEVLAWLRSLDLIPSQPGGAVADQIEGFSSSESRSKVAQLIVKQSKSKEGMRGAIRSFFEDYNLLADLVGRRIEEVRRSLVRPETDFSTVERNLSTWGEWLGSQAESKSKVPQGDKSESQEVADKLALTRSRLEEEKRKGRLIRERKAYLESTLRLLEAGWTSAHPEECPACGSNVAELGGITKRVKELIRQSDAEINELIAAVENSNADLQTLQVKLVEAGSAATPLTDSERSEVLAILQWLTPTSTPFERYISESGNRNALLGTARAVMTIPEAPRTLEDVVSRAEALLAEILEEWDRAEAALALPTAWEKVRKEVVSNLTKIVEDHLPRTTQRLWREIALALTAANWVNHRLPEMKASTGRRDQKLTLEIDGRLPRYILNQCETHVLGFAWFITEYLLKGRFEVPLMILDDPAQEMDQTTYREFSRFLETLVRLHRKREIPLTQIVLMHQESRAFELATALRAQWMALNWRGEGAESSEITLAYDPHLYPQAPQEAAQAAS